MAVGMRVALAWLACACACGDCRYCNSGRETLCEQQRNSGYAFDGAFAEHALGYAATWSGYRTASTRPTPHR